MPAYIASYLHGEGRIGVLVHLECVDDFVLRTSEFKTLARDIAMHIAAMQPIAVSPDDLDPGIWDDEVSRYRPMLSGLSVEKRQELLRDARKRHESNFCLLKQPFVKDDRKTVEQLISDESAQLGKNIRIVKFVRYDANET